MTSIFLNKSKSTKLQKFFVITKLQNPKITKLLVYKIHQKVIIFPNNPNLNTEFLEVALGRIFIECFILNHILSALIGYLLPLSES